MSIQLTPATKNVIINLLSLLLGLLGGSSVDAFLGAPSPTPPCVCAPPTTPEASGFRLQASGGVSGAETRNPTPDPPSSAPAEGTRRLDP